MRIIYSLVKSIAKILLGIVLFFVLLYIVRPILPGERTLAWNYEVDRFEAQIIRVNPYLFGPLLGRFELWVLDKTLGTKKLLFWERPSRLAKEDVYPDVGPRIGKKLSDLSYTMTVGCKMVLTKDGGATWTIAAPNSPDRIEDCRK